MKKINVRNVVLGEGLPKICVSLTGKTEKDLVAQADAAYKAKVDLVEWRVDFYDGLHSVEMVLGTLALIRSQLRDLPLIFTLRTTAEGGMQDVSISHYKEIYDRVSMSNFTDVVDIELNQSENLGAAFISQIKARGTTVIMSSHEFQSTPDNSILLFRLNMMEHLGADIGKIAVMPQHRKDVIRLLEMTIRAEAFVSLPLITMSMGELGKGSRLLGELSGSIMTFASLDEESAPGQMPLADVRAALELLHIDPTK